LVLPRPEDFDPFDPETIANPFPFYEALRKHAPVFEMQSTGYYLITRFSDVCAAALDTETFSSNLVAIVTEGVADGPEILDLTNAPRPADVLAIADAPTHTRQRKLTNKAFSFRRVAKLEPFVTGLMDELFEAFGKASEVDWMKAVGLPFPMRIISELVGFPTEDADRIQRWSDDALDLLSGIQSQERLGKNALSVIQLSQYLESLVLEAKEDPGENVLGDLVRATQGDGEVLSDEEVVSILVQLATAGQETTGSLIASAALLLARDHALQDRLRAEPERIPAFIEEVIRLESPFYGHFRQATREVEIAGVPLPEGARVMLCWAAANRDEEEFENPEQVDLDRDNLHVGFGFGPHLCIGAALARLEARVALESLLARTQEFSLARPEEPLKYVESLFLRRLKSLPLALTYV
jgi:cytochrome P450